MRIVADADELRGDPDLLCAITATVPSDGPLDDVAHSELLADLSDRLPPTVVMGRSRARDNGQIGDSRETARDLFRHFSGEASIVGRPEALEGKDDEPNRGLLDSRRMGPRGELPLDEETGEHPLKERPQLLSAVFRRYGKFPGLRPSRVGLRHDRQIVRR
jgi:hypothetical protein